MNFERTGKPYLYIADLTRMHGDWILYTPNSSNDYFEKAQTITISPIGTDPGAVEMVIAGGTSPQTIRLVIGRNHGEPCWLFGTGHMDSLFFVFLPENGYTHPDGHVSRALAFERFDTDGARLDELPWVPGQIKHAVVVPEATTLNQDDEGSGYQPP